MFLVVAVFQFHSLGIQSISWHDFDVPVFFPIIAIQWDYQEVSRSLFGLVSKVVEFFNESFFQIKGNFLLRIQRELNTCPSKSRPRGRFRTLWETLG